MREPLERSAAVPAAAATIRLGRSNRPELPFSSGPLRLSQPQQPLYGWGAVIGLSSRFHPVRCGWDSRAPWCTARMCPLPRINEHALVNAAGAEDIDIVQDSKSDLVRPARSDQVGNLQLDLMWPEPRHGMLAVPGVLTVDPDPGLIDDCRREQPNRFPRRIRRKVHAEPVPKK